MKLPKRFAVTAFTASPAQSNTRIAITRPQLNQPQSAIMHRSSESQLASRAIPAEARQTEKAEVGELRKVKEVVGVAIVEKAGDKYSDSEGDDESEVDILDG